jgi:hypothetical protein
METNRDKTTFLPLPEYPGKAPRNGWKSYFLGCYACIMTITLILVLIGGFVYIKTNQGSTDEKTKLVLLSTGGSVVEEDDIHLTDTIFTAGQNGSIIVLDYQKRSLGVYMREVDTCMLATDLDIHTPREGQYLSHKKSHMTLVADDEEVTSELLPVKMSSLCAKKGVVHMKKTSPLELAPQQKNHQQASRRKRGCERVCRCELVCSNRCETRCSCSIECSF